MSLESKIKEAFMRDRRIREASNWDPDTQPNIYELSNFLKKSGYRLVDILLHDGKPELVVEAVNPGYLYPDIIHDIKDGNFYIKVVDHGLLVVSDVESIITGYEAAMSVATHLESIDLNNLEIEED